MNQPIQEGLNEKIHNHDFFPGTWGGFQLNNLHPNNIGLHCHQKMDEQTYYH
uniref:Uncharacterized protein n=1 Tax=Rhizophora mucronata TaxID=61149 RepID=A0A2P2Q8X2_RHIMU